MKRKILFATLILFGLLVLAAFGIFLKLWMQPDILLTPERLRWAIDRYVDQPNRLQWEDLQIDIDSPNFWTRDFDLKFEGLCYEDPAMKACLTGSSDFKIHIRPSLEIHVENLQITKSWLHLLERNEKETPPPSASSKDLLLSWHAGAVLDRLRSFRISKIENLNWRIDEILKSGIEQSASASIQADFETDSLHAEITLQIQNESELLAQTDECKLQASGDSDDSDLRFNCFVIASAPAAMKDLKLPSDDLKLQILLDLKVRDSHLSEESFIDIELRDWTTTFLEVSAQLHSESLFSNVSDAHSWELLLDIRSFQGFLDWLRNFDLEPPAPLHVLDGTAQIKVLGNFKSLQMKDLSLDLELTSDLSSKDQKVDIVAQGEARVSRAQTPAKLQIQADILFKTLELVAPPLGVRGLPPLIPDDRFVSDAASKPDTPPPAQKWNVEYDLKLRSEQPAQIKTDFAPQDVPVSFDIQIKSGSQPLGKIQVHQTPLEVLRRKVDLLFFELHLKKEPLPDPIEAELRIEQSGYTISAQLDGSVEEPRLRLTSDPPLSNDDIYSVLLFGTTLEGLESEEISSVSNFRGAAVARALTLASLYFFMSTPIQSVSYNPETGAVRAQVRLPQGIALQLGLDEEGARQVGLRRRLGKGFFIETDLSQPRAKDQDSEVSAFLQWYKRH